MIWFGIIWKMVADPHHINADLDPDPDFHFDADLDPDPAPYQYDGNLRPLVYRLFKAQFLSLQASIVSVQGPSQL
jgi:hypothetical protein